MGTRTALTEEQYLHTSFDDLDKEFRDGELEDKSLPDYPFQDAGPADLLLHALKEEVSTLCAARIAAKDPAWPIPRSRSLRFPWPGTRAACPGCATADC